MREKCCTPWAGSSARLGREGGCYWGHCFSCSDPLLLGMRIKSIRNQQGGTGQMWKVKTDGVILVI